MCRGEGEAEEAVCYCMPAICDSKTSIGITVTNSHMHRPYVRAATPWSRPTLRTQMCWYLDCVAPAVVRR